MRFLDFDRFESISPEVFRAAKPYPFVNPHGLLTQEGFETLLADLPDRSLFEARMGEERRGGQMPHDRYSLEYAPDTEVSASWRAFIEELRSDRYRNHIARLFGARNVEFRFHWHYTPTGCSVSPHTDSTREYGSHLFYFNPEADWDPSWGGETLVLDDAGRLDFNSAPDLAEFGGETACQCIGNYSAILMRTDHAWHAVRPIACPEGRLRKVFIVVVNPRSLAWRLRDRTIGKRKQAF